jgi:hypothetical protein
VSCNKIPFATKGDAKTYMRDLARKRSANLMPYACPNCNLWHLTSIPKKLNRAITRRKRLQGDKP